MRLIAIFKPRYGVLRLPRSRSTAGHAAGHKLVRWLIHGVRFVDGLLPARYKRNGDSEKTTERLYRGQVDSNFYVLYPLMGEVIETAVQLGTCPRKISMANYLPPFYDNPTIDHLGSTLLAYINTREV